MTYLCRATLLNLFESFKKFNLSNIEMLIAKIFNSEQFDSKIASNILCKFIFCDFSTNYPDNVIIDN